MNLKFPISVLAGAAVLLAAAELPVAPIETYKPAERRFWAFQPRAKVNVPQGARNPVDAFILQGLAKAGLQPAPQADRATLIRRVTFDLHGLPPTPEEIDAFVNDASPQAWEHLVDRLLASPRYGEQWGRHWLDVVRFAESDGYEYDTHRSDAYRYRDYVVNSFNADKPYDRFVKEQLAGDEMDPGNETYLIASGFNRLGPLRKNAGNQKVAGSRNEVLTEMTNIVGAAFLGVTVGCARCHDHKFDPFRQTDYYRLMAYFAQTQAHDLVQATDEEQAAWKMKAEPVQTQITALRAKMAKAADDEKATLAMKLDDLEDQLPAPLPSVYTVADDAKDATPIYTLFHGDYLAPALKVGARPLGILVPDGTREEPVETATPRLKLANWIADEANPLTARVMANRIWQYHFGRGIVNTPNDFGRMGGRPSNPELLDYIANELVANGWHMKPIHRMILLSKTYQQASQAPAEQDPENALLSRFSRRRLEAEELRDSMLAVAGRLNPKTGGPGVMAPIDEDLVKMLKRPQYWVTNRDASEYDRRSLYMIYKRNLQMPFMGVFDAPDTLLSCPRREQSTHAPQALEMMNGATSNTLAEAFAERLRHEAKTDEERVELAWRLAVGRAPNAREKALAMEYLAKDGRLKELALDVFNLNAFLYVN
jgi:hypothetical protein